jgi:hypothetical protein
MLARKLHLKPAGVVHAHMDPVRAVPLGDGDGLELLDEPVLRRL